MKKNVLVVAVSIVASGCATQSVPVGKPVSLEEAIASFQTAAQNAMAAKLAESIAAGDSGLFPLRAQAVSLTILAFRSEKNSWPTSKDDLSIFLADHFKEAAPAAEELADLKIVPLSTGGLVFAFGSAASTASGYHLLPDGTISFPLPTARPLPASVRPQLQSPPQPSHGFPWEELVVKLIFEVLFHPRK